MNLRLALFVGLALFAAVLLYRGEETRTRVVKVERRTVNACVDNQPRPCRELLNRLLAYATPHQRKEIRRAQANRSVTLAAPKVQAGTPPKRVPKRPVKDKRPPASTAPPTPPLRPSPGVPEPNPPATPSPQPSEPSKPPEPVLPPALCEPLKDLQPLC